VPTPFKSVRRLIFRGASPLIQVSLQDDHHEDTNDTKNLSYENDFVRFVKVLSLLLSAIEPVRVNDHHEDTKDTKIL